MNYLILSPKNIFFTFANNFCREKDRIAVSSKWEPARANSFKCCFEQKCLKKFSKNLKPDFC